MIVIVYLVCFLVIEACVYYVVKGVNSRFGSEFYNKWHFVKAGDLPKKSGVYICVYAGELLPGLSHGVIEDFAMEFYYETIDGYFSRLAGQRVDNVVAWCEFPCFDRRRY